MNINRLLDLAVECNLPPESYFWEWDNYAEWQFRLMSRYMKVKPSDYLLDVGCGAMRFGHLAVPYLDDGHYCGMDAYPPYVEVGRRLMEELNIDKQYQLVLSDQFNFDIFGKTFDFAIAQSVIGHLSRPDIKRCLFSLTKVMAPGGKFYATLNFGGRSKQEVGFFYGGRHPFRHPVLRDMSFYNELVDELGIRLEETDIPHPAQTTVIFHF